MFDYDQAQLIVASSFVIILLGGSVFARTLLRRLPVAGYVTDLDLQRACELDIGALLRCARRQATAALFMLIIVAGLLWLYCATGASFANWLTPRIFLLNTAIIGFGAWSDYDIARRISEKS